ncbi:unnamed protein product [Spirodela intermedia]|uniref:Uncharacterized protein n=1 Tax=Spirodela intermedia TaxID=51605 RepID=A0A7I8KHC9_SPIIN|nr:unnamed protein product [Spirodela intermedia]
MAGERRKWVSAGGRERERKRWGTWRWRERVGRGFNGGEREREVLVVGEKKVAE